VSYTDRKIREKEKTRQRIMDAAVEIAAREGWMAVTIRKIADEIEYTPPIVYEHFINKDDLFRELVYSGFRILNREIKKAQQSETDPKELLYKLSAIHWDFAFSHRHLFQLMFSLERPAPSEEMNFQMRLIHDIFLGISNKKKEITGELILTWIFLCHGAVTIVMQHPDPPPEMTERDPKKIFLKVIRRFIDLV
jgi:AcrR family transcriptional regulator